MKVRVGNKTSYTLKKYHYKMLLSKYYFFILQNKHYPVLMMQNIEMKKELKTNLL